MNEQENKNGHPNDYTVSLISENLVCNGDISSSNRSPSKAVPSDSQLDLEVSSILTNGQLKENNFEKCSSSVEVNKTNEPILLSPDSREDQFEHNLNQKLENTEETKDCVKQPHLEKVFSDRILAKPVDTTSHSRIFTSTSILHDQTVKDNHASSALAGSTSRNSDSLLRRNQDKSKVITYPERRFKNQAELMLNAVREIKTPWAKQLELKLAEEIKDHIKAKQNSLLNMKREINSREHRSLMQAMKEIGTGWAQDIEQAKYLKKRKRKERIAYNNDSNNADKTSSVPILSKSIGVQSIKNSSKIVNETSENVNAIKSHNKNDTKIAAGSRKAQLLLKQAVKVGVGAKNRQFKVIKETAAMQKNKQIIRQLKCDGQKYVLNTQLKKLISDQTINRVDNVNHARNELGQHVISVSQDKFKPSDNYNSEMTRLLSIHNSSACSKNSVPLPKSVLNKYNTPIVLIKPVSALISKANKQTSFTVSNLKNVDKVKACIEIQAPVKHRHSARQEQISVFKYIGIKRHNNFIQVILLNKNNTAFLSKQALNELKSVFTSAKMDPSCKLVLLNGSGRVFCSGIDIASLCCRDNQKIATELSVLLRDVLKMLLNFPKPVIAGVNGSAVGLGVTILPLCDLIYASDKATFYTPYSKFSQVPEGGASFSFPHILGPAIASDMLIGGRILTAQEACQYGLVSQVIWPSQFMETLIPKVESLAAESSQGMEATKQLMKACYKSQLEAYIDKECCLLTEQWISPACQKSIQTMLKHKCL
ncbi:Uncharacterised protein g3664 [Pycnogonum litorale]